MIEITVRLDAFEGPLDLLYHLIEKSEIDIYDIPIARLTDQYLEYLDAAEDRDMDGMSEFLVMAATLLEIKSKLLLPRPKNEEEEGMDPREELVQRLLEYKKIKDVTTEWRQYEEDAALTLYKEADKAVRQLKEKEPQSLEDYLQGVAMEDLYLAFRQVMARKETKVDHIRSSFKTVPKDLFTVQEKMEYIRDMLILQPKTTFFSIFRKKAGRMEKVVTFLALLELIKRKEVQIFQKMTFGEITISRFDGRDSA
ncbi:segregation and condensation protein A [Anaerotignum neopropionicum]|uniref:Segregation and condensation protein A n=1 Tax=Anaerotignum neopropionicum TaxID=36847 RepID=A0A136WDK6_9FIRM|nr:segregation/condensation protein A [Anaerotignum neopropionicum]KXL52564.1 segregation and condensation protein A [Anaerotignum neopropionicum]